MANKEVVTVLTVKTEQSQNTIKGLKQEIADLKKQLDSAVIGTDEFERASKELATAQANLKTVLADGKKTTDAVEGSYNHLVATMAELKKQWKATADEVKRNELGQQIDSINSKLKDMDASTGNFQRNVGDYANQFKDAFEEQQKSTQNVRLGLDGLQKTAAGLASGYAAVQGVMNLLNIENSNFEKAMIKVQSAMAIAQGVGGMKDLIEGAGTLKVMFNGAITSVKGFIAGLSGVKKAIAATGIGLLVVALGTLVAYWDDVNEVVNKFIKKTDSAKESVERLANAQDGLTQSIKRTNSDLERQLKIEKSLGVSEEEIAKKRLKNAEENYNKQSALVEQMQKEFNEASFWNRQGSKTWTDERLAEFEKELKQSKELLRQYTEDYKNSQTELTVVQNTQSKKRQEEDKAANERLIAAAKAKKDAVLAIAEEARKSNIDTEKEEIAELEKVYKTNLSNFKKYRIDTTNLTEQFEREKEEIKKKYAEKDKAETEKALSIQEKNIDRWADLERRKLEKQQKAREDWSAENEVDLDGNSDGWYTPEELEKYQTFLDTKQTMYAESISAENMLIQSQIEKLQELANAQAAAGMDNTGTLQSVEDLKLQLEDNNAAILDNEKETLKAKAKANAEYAKQQKAQEKMLADYKLNIASNVLGSLASILGEESAAGKAAAVAQATIDTYMAANAAYSAMAGIPVVGPALGAAAAAAAVIAGVANVKKILSVKAGDKDSSSSNISATAAVNPSINLGETMPIQYTRELLTDSETTNLNKEQRVYVLESDISNTQENVKVKESNSSF